MDPPSANLVLVHTVPELPNLSFKFVYLVNSQGETPRANRPY
jgi:hypothetical protein